MAAVVEGLSELASNLIVVSVWIQTSLELHVRKSCPALEWPGGFPQRSSSFILPT